MSQNEERKLLMLMDQLITALDGLQEEPALRQMLLEIHWLRQNLSTGNVIIPTKWQLLIFKPPAVLHQHAELARLVRRLVFLLRAYALKSTTPTGQQVQQ